MVNSKLTLMTSKDASAKYDLTAHFPFLRAGSWLVCDGEMYVDGNLEFDAYDSTVWMDTDKAADWRKKFGLTWGPTGEEIAGIIVNGNLHITESLLNGDDGDIAFLLVLGNLYAENLMAGGAIMRVTGDVNANQCVYSCYNDGSLRIGGNMNTPIYINDEHATVVDGKINAKAKSTNGTLTKAMRELLTYRVTEPGDIVKLICNNEYILRMPDEQPPKLGYDYWLAKVVKNPDVCPLTKVPEEFRTEQFYYDAVKTFIFDYFSLKCLPMIPAQMYSERINEVIRKLYNNNLDRLHSSLALCLPVHLRTLDIFKKLFENRKKYSDVYSGIVQLVPPSLLEDVLNCISEADVEGECRADYFVDRARVAINKGNYADALSLLETAKTESIKIEKGRKNHKVEELTELGYFRPYYYEGYIHFLQGDKKAATALLKIAKEQFKYNDMKHWRFVDVVYCNKSEFMKYEKRREMENNE